ncbi:hypothetical protein V5O48_018708, partial [Marasmius crinis-equi]
KKAHNKWLFSEEQEKQFRVKLTYDNVKEWLLSTKRAQLKDDMRKKDTSFPQPSHTNNMAKKSSEGIPIPTVVEKTHDDTFTDTTTYPDWLLTYASFAHTAPIPLGLFAHKNLEYINSSRHLIHFEKQTLPRSKLSVCVIDMAKLCKDRNVSMKDTENLTITQFSYTADFWWAFEAEREKGHGVSLHSMWAGKHLAAWESFLKRESTFAIWKPKELEQRNK